ncbi:MAG: hypothetical protein J6M14_02175 [Campylobacter sp.]|nr:hypothetical protein [Campylobacter sp.]
MPNKKSNSILVFLFLFICAIKAQVAFGQNSSEILYKSDLKDNLVYVLQDARGMKLSSDGKKLFSYGHNRSGVAILDISNPHKITTLGTYKFPEATYSVNNINLAISKDAKNLYIADPHNGVWHLDISDPENIKEMGVLPLVTALQIKLSKDEKTAFVKTAKGFFAIDISGAQMKKIGEFLSDTGESESDYFGIRPRGDFAFLSDSEILFINFNDLYILDISNPANILAKHHSYDFNIVRSGKFAMMYEFEISPDATRLYAKTDNGFRIYDISDIKNIKFLSEYLSSGSVDSFEIDFGANLVYLGKFAKQEEGKFARIEVVDISYEMDPALFKSYNMPENHSVFAKLSKDRGFIFLQSMPSDEWDSYVSVIENKPSAKNAEFKEISPNLANQESIWEMPFAKLKIFNEIQSIKPNKSGYILGVIDSEKNGKLIQTDQNGLIMWEKAINAPNLRTIDTTNTHIITPNAIVDIASSRIIKRLDFNETFRNVVSFGDDFVACDHHNNLYFIDQNLTQKWKRVIKTDLKENYTKYEYNADNMLKGTTRHSKTKAVIDQILKTKDNKILLSIAGYGLVKYDTNASLIFEKRLDDWEYVRLIQAKDGSIFALKTQKEKGFFYNGIARVMKFDANANLIWDKNLHRENGDDYTTYLLSEYGDNILLTVSKSDNAKFEVWIKFIEFDKNGNQLAQNLVSGYPKNTRLLFASNTHNGDVVLGGSTIYEQYNPPVLLKGKMVKLSDHIISSGILIKIPVGIALSKHQIRKFDEEFLRK